MKDRLARFSSLGLILAILSSACGGAAAATQTPQPTAAPAASPTPEVATTQITIDGDASDWDKYPVNLIDAAGDQVENYTDILEARFFKNDEYLYVLVKENQGAWDDLAVGLRFNDGNSGQLNLYPPGHLTTRGEGDSYDVEAEVEIAESIEIKVALDQLPAEVTEIFGIAFFDHPGHGDGPVDDAYEIQLSLQTVEEVEPAVPLTQATVDGDPSGRLTQITIDGDSGDWGNYSISNTDASGDQLQGGSDLATARYFANDKYLYGLISFHNNGDWGNIALGVELVSGRNQLTLRQSRHASIEDHDVRSEIAILDTAIEFKVALEDFSGTVRDISSICIYGDQELDCFDNETNRKQFTIVDEQEPEASQTGSGLATTSGQIFNDETWSGEVHLTGDISLAEGVTLTIQPGTTVYLASNSDDQLTGDATVDEYISSHQDPVGSEEWDKNAILIDGRGGIINFVGTEEDPIIFKPEGNSTSSAQWSGIFVERGTIQYSKILNAGRNAILTLGFLGERIEIAHNEITNFHWCGICSQTLNVWIHHNVVNGGAHQAMAAGTDSVVEFNIMKNCQNAMFIAGINVTVRNNIVIDCARGLQIDAGPRVIPAGSELSFINNTVLWIDGPPDGWYYQGEFIYESFASGYGIAVFEPNLKVTFENNIIYGPFSWGIGIFEKLGANSVVDYNLIWDTDDDYTGSGTGGIGSHNIFADPLITFDVAQLLYTLASGSPAIDAGAPGTTDADGSPADLGAYGGEHGDDW